MKQSQLLKCGNCQHLKYIKKGDYICQLSTCHRKYYDIICDKFLAKSVNKKYKVTKHKKTTSTLCWHCKHALHDYCSWISNAIPVEGWEAKAVIIDGFNTTRCSNSFIVKKCPMFEKDEVRFKRK